MTKLLTKEEFICKVEEVRDIALEEFFTCPANLEKVDFYTIELMIDEKIRIGTDYLTAMRLYREAMNANSDDVNFIEEDGSLLICLKDSMPQNNDEPYDTYL